MKLTRLERRSSDQLPDLRQVARLRDDTDFLAGD